MRQRELYALANEMRGIACQGLLYGVNDYDRDRYRRIMALSARLTARLESSSEREVLERFEGNLYHLSPQAGAEALVVRGGAILLIRRSDNGLWAVPGGLAEIGETLAEAAVRELYEETTLVGEARHLVALFDSRYWQITNKVHLYSAVFNVDAGDAEPLPSTEATEVGFFRSDCLPPLAPGHAERVPFLFKLLHGEIAGPYFDVPEVGRAEDRRVE